MHSKIYRIFRRDLKSNSRDFISLYILFIPFIFGVIINLIVPSVNETMVNLVMVENENHAQVAYLNEFAKIKLVEDHKSLTDRVRKRDDYIGVYTYNEQTSILIQGNEDQSLIEYVKLLVLFEKEGVDYSKPNATIHSFGRSTHPLKSAISNWLLMILGVLGGMLIGINIVEEKVDNTISAINVTPISRLGFILGKSVIGILIPIYGTFALVYITGFTGVNIMQLLVLSLIGSIIGIVIGFFEGTKNTDVLEVSASIKAIFIPIIACICAVEFLSQKWQVLFYWLPWYWIYKGNQSVLAYEATWEQIGLYTIYVLIPTTIVFIYLRKGIKKGLE